MSRAAHMTSRLLDEYFHDFHRCRAVVVEAVCGTAFHQVRLPWFHLNRLSVGEIQPHRTIDWNEQVVLNVVMLVYPIEAIKAWQGGS